MESTYVVNKLHSVVASFFKNNFEVGNIEDTLVVTKSHRRQKIKNTRIV